MVRQDQLDILTSFPFTAGCKTLGITGRSSDLSWFLKPSHSIRTWRDVNSGHFSNTMRPWNGLFGFTAAGTVTDSNGIPFSFHRLGRYMETNDEIKVRNKCLLRKA